MTLLKDRRSGSEAILASPRLFALQASRRGLIAYIQVTDSTPAILGQRDLVEVVDAALQGGVTIVQYRDKVNETEVLVSTARKLHAVTQKRNVPLLINDRVDVALAVGCEGVHLGQTDLGRLSYFTQVIVF
jgi:thiamine-phosphate diphosphorylase